MRDSRPGGARESSHPPSDPHPAAARRAQASDDRPVRVQLVVALLVGLVLVAAGLYLWRRPRAAADGAAAEAASAEEPEDAGVAPPVFDAAPPPVTLAEARVLGCHDRGPKVTAAEDCDRLPAVEQALARAVEQSAACFPTTLDGATIEYVVDVSFSRHHLKVTTPRAGRSERDRKVVAGCGTAVREAMQSLGLEGIEHQHARYDVAVTATYRGKG